MKLHYPGTGKNLVVYIDFILLKCDGKYYTESTHILFIKALSQSFSKVTICARCEPSSQALGLEINTDHLKIVELPFYENHVKLWLKLPFILKRITKQIEKAIDRESVLWLCWPHPVSLSIISKYYTKAPLFITIRQNMHNLVKLRYRNPERFFGLAMVNWMEWILRLFFKRITIFTTGNEMYLKTRKHFQNVFEIKTPVISTQQIGNSVSKKTDNVFSILFVGRLAPEKGLTHLLDAMKHLVEQMISVRLDLVGSGPMHKQLSSYIAQNDLGQQVHLHGHKAFGPELFSHYQNADCLILPSMSEGFPKVINEARAFGLPIITTNCGGISGEIRHGENGWIIESASSQSIADAILELSQNKALEEKLAAGAKADFGENNLEYWSNKMFKIISEQFQLMPNQDKNIGENPAKSAQIKEQAFTPFFD